MEQAGDSPKQTTEDRPIDQVNSQKSAHPGQELAQRIRGRYDGSPGVLPLRVTQGLAKRVSRFRNSQLPLLSHLQRRQTLAEGFFQSSLSELPYARLSAVTGFRSSAIQRGQDVAAAPSPRLGTPDSVTTVTVPAILSRSAVSAQPPPDTAAALKEGPPAPQLQAVTRVSKLGTASLQRRLDGPGEKPLQRQIASTLGVAPISRSLANQVLQGEARVSASLDAPPPTGRGSKLTPETPGVAPFSGAGTGKRGTAILQRRDASEEKPLLRQKTSVVEVAPISRTLDEQAPQGAITPSSGTRTGRLGKTVLQRRSNRPLEEPLHRQGIGPRLSNAESSLPVVGRLATIEAPMNQVVQRFVEGPEPMVEGITISERKPGAGLPLARTPSLGIGMPGGRTSSRQYLYPTSSELPFSRVPGTGAIRGGEGIATLPVISGTPREATIQRAEVQASNNTMAPEIYETDWSSPASKPSSPVTAASRLEGPELERLADSVYTIIERRLILERESRGF
ncbi:MAG: hypothetical protein KJ077_19850 [Anaerolineae bacterium]|nr:hypothetical protein [Anaerolineae bacterium]